MYNLGLTLWNQSSFEFKFDDCNIPHNKIGHIKKMMCPDIALFSWDSQQGRDRATSGHNNKKLIGPILFLYYE